MQELNIPNERSRRSHLRFIEHCWQKTEEFKKGIHTVEICDRIDRAFQQFDNGESVFLIIKVPFRHGKSDIISRYLPPHYLGKYPDNEVLVATYGADFANGLSRAARHILKSDKYKELYPEINISIESSSVQDWSLKESLGATHWSGIGGSITGRGYHLGIIDDFLKNRKDAESLLIRENQWEWFKDVFLTRRAPIAITIILATPWHIDDILGRIKKEMKSNPDFPGFEEIVFPAFDEKYDEGVLFPERFSKLWYTQQRGTLGSYGTASLLQCDPTIRGGNFLKVDTIKIITPAQLPADLNWVRGWDLASTEEERTKTDPDFTVGVHLAVKLIPQEEINEPMPIIYIKHVVRIRSEAPDRNKRIQQTAIADGDSVRVGIETVAGYKDTYTIMKDILAGLRVVDNINVSRDKLSRAAFLEPVFEAGNVYFVEGEWNQCFIDELEHFPNGLHDDQVDGLICGYEMTRRLPFFGEDVMIETETGSAF